ncbi:unnamed protein product, partial [Amoebophrya sp. A25]
LPSSSKRSTASEGPASSSASHCRAEGPSSPQAPSGESRPSSTTPTATARSATSSDVQYHVTSSTDAATPACRRLNRLMRLSFEMR